MSAARTISTRASLAVCVALLTLASIVSPAAADPTSEVFSPDELVAIFDNAELPGLGDIGPAPSITGNTTVDERIRELGSSRGYSRRPEPSRSLEAIQGFSLQPEAAAGWRALQSDAAAAGHSLTISSAHRSVSTQVSIFRRRLSGTSDAAIESVLRSVAVPGYSKHHTGYAVDIRSGGVGGYSIRNTAGYGWLSANNFANARAHGWLPSYPEGAVAAGPNPEPWEWVWVGASNIECASFVGTPEVPFCDIEGSSFADDIVWLTDNAITTGCSDTRFCTATTITRAQPSTMLWRFAGEPSSEAEIPFADLREGAYYVEAVRWMVENGITTGTTRTTFAPDRPLSRAEFVTFLWRMSDRPETTDPLVFTDVDPDGFAAGPVTWANEVGVTNGISATVFSPNDAATRGQAAAFIHRFSEVWPPEPVSEVLT